MTTINELLDRYGALMHEAGIVKGELLAKLHFAKEFASIPELPEQRIEIQIPEGVAVPSHMRNFRRKNGKDEVAVPYSNILREYFKAFPDVIHIDPLLLNLKKLHPQHTFVKHSVLSVLTRLTKLKEVRHVEYGTYSGNGKVV